TDRRAPERATLTDENGLPEDAAGLELPVSVRRPLEWKLRVNHWSYLSTGEERPHILFQLERDRALLSDGACAQHGRGDGQALLEHRAKVDGRAGSPDQADLHQ